MKPLKAPHFMQHTLLGRSKLRKQFTAASLKLVKSLVFKGLESESLVPELGLAVEVEIVLKTDMTGE